MKKIALLFALLTIAMVSVAQDVIVTKKAGRIDAKIIEISDNGVRYRLWAENNGVTHALSADEVASILFANGETYVFPQKSDPQQIKNGLDVMERQEYEDDNLAEWTDTNYQEFPILLKSGKEIMFRTGTQIEMRNNTAYYGGVRLKKKEYEELLRYCPSAFSIYVRSKGHEVIENTLYGIGLVSIVYGCYNGWAFQEKYPNIRMDNIDKQTKSELLRKTLLPLGLFCVIVISGSICHERAITIIDDANTKFNQSYAWKAKRPTPELSMCALLNGFCLTFSF